MHRESGLLKQRAFIYGEWVEARSERRFSVTDPATGQSVATVPDMNAEDTRDAIHSAEAALPAWRALLASERAEYLTRWCNLVRENENELAHLLSLEQGKPIHESLSEIRYGASFIQWFAEEARRIYGDVIPAHTEHSRIMVLKQPIGVVGAITPWNFPNAMITRKVAPALAAGCTVIIKPAEDTPLSALALAELADRANFPPGVLNVVTTNLPAEVGRALTDSPVVRKISFTGSTEVGKQLMRQCADTVKKLSLELGGNAPFIVFADADLDDAVEGAMSAKFRNSGQTCICANRILVQDSIYKAFEDQFTKAVAQLTVGAATEDNVSIGPMISESAVEKLERLLLDATSNGANIVVGGSRHELGGTFFQPTVLTEIRPDMSITREEIFGPVAPLMGFSDEQEAIAMANATPYGLAAYCYTTDLGRSWRVSEALEYGIVGINTGLISTAVAPFGGMKESGLGREGSRYGIDEYLEIKYVCVGGLRGPPSSK